MKGALIITHVKESVSQIYAQARLLDTTNCIRFNRLTSSLQLKSPIVEFLTPEKALDKE